ncbi:hypothetical protein Ct9H90mP12_2870 [bacterium]|nr:MAG: hypothetical protein Ct9H90mP12_2870 [bacterium]
MVVEFFKSVAPKHVEVLSSMPKWILQGTLFHRVIPGYDPKVVTRIQSPIKSELWTGGHAAKYFGVGNESEPTPGTYPRVK